MLMRKPTDYIDTYYRDTMLGAHSYEPLVDTIQADVCVIGGGLAGLNTAMGLLDRGRNPVVIEGNRIGWGASGRNGGFVAKGYACNLATLKKKVGLDHARSLVNMTTEARDMIKQRIEKLNIPCGPMRSGVLTVSWRDNPNVVRDIVDDINESFGLGFEFWGRDRVREHCRTDRYYDAFYSPHDFQFHPLNYVQGLAADITARGGQVFEGTKATKITSLAGNRWRVETASGGVVEADHVVLCCSIYINGLDKRLRNAAFPVRTFVMVTDPVDPQDLKDSINTEHAIYDMRFASDYYRVLPDNRIMWGGRVSIGQDPDRIAELLEGDLLKVYPQLRGKVRAAYGWSGELCYAPHKMPQIGQLAPNYWYATCFGGHGLAPTTVGGEVIAGAIASGDERYKLFSPFGLNFAGGPIAPYVAQSVYWWWRLRDYLG